MSGADGLCARVPQDSPDFPAALRGALGAAVPSELVMRGDPALLRADLLALFCSVRTPPELVLPTYDLARALRDTGVPVIGGFQSPLERDCLEYLLEGSGPVVVCPARDIERMRIPGGWQAAVERSRMLLVSPSQRARRPTQALAMQRNLLVAALAGRLCVVHASPGGRLHRVVEQALAWGRRVECLPHPLNRDLLLLGATVRGSVPSVEALP